MDCSDRSDRSERDPDCTERFEDDFWDRDADTDAWEDTLLDFDFRDTSERADSLAANSLAAVWLALASSSSLGTALGTLGFTKGQPGRAACIAFCHAVMASRCTPHNTLKYKRPALPRGGGQPGGIAVTQRFIAVRIILRAA